VNIPARPTEIDKIMMQSRDEIGKSGYDRLRCDRLQPTVSPSLGDTPAGFREYR
jgi:hypothetical protein